MQSRRTLEPATHSRRRSRSDRNQVPLHNRKELPQSGGGPLSTPTPSGASNNCRRSSLLPAQAGVAPRERRIVNLSPVRSRVPNSEHAANLPVLQDRLLQEPPSGLPLVSCAGLTACVICGGSCEQSPLGLGLNRFRQRHDARELRLRIRRSIPGHMKSLRVPQMSGSVIRSRTSWAGRSPAVHGPLDKCRSGRIGQNHAKESVRPAPPTPSLPCE
jgi:hypothetical protein